MIGIVDYGAGNLRSVKKAFDFLGTKSVILSEPSAFENVDRVVLPGVGSFGHAVDRLRKTKLFDTTKDWLDEGRSFLGICLGLQLLFETSEESPDVAGFGFFNGTCRRFNERKVPQIGWNSITKEKHSPLLEGIETGAYFYFNHSYYVVLDGAEEPLASTTYGVDYASVVGNGRVYAVQFHPEKSGDLGIRLSKNWIDKC